MTAIIAFSLLKVLRLVLEFYRWSLVIYAVMGWLVLFNIVNYHNQFVYLVNNFLRRLLEPILRPLRAMIPPMGGLDLSFLALFLLIYLMQSVVEGGMRYMFIKGMLV